MVEFKAGVRLRGVRMPGAPPPSILWGYRTAITLKSWRIRREQNTWKLRAVPEMIDAFQARQQPLFFSAPRKQGFWLWPVEQIDIVGPNLVQAILGQPEQ